MIGQFCCRSLAVVDLPKLNVGFEFRDQWPGWQMSDGFVADAAGGAAAAVAVDTATGAGVADVNGGKSDCATFISIRSIRLMTALPYPLAS